MSTNLYSTGLLFDTTIVLIQHYLQGTDNRKYANILSFSERLIVPVGTALLLGSLYGTRGILASAAIGKMVLLIFVTHCILCKGFPKYWYDIMFLPKDFGGKEEDNLYEEIRTKNDVIPVSNATEQFCLEHSTSQKTAQHLSLFVEEMAINVLEYGDKTGKNKVYADFRLFLKDSDVCFSIADLGERFDPTMFYELHKDLYPEQHIGIGLVMEMAKEVRYFSAFNSNNLIVYLNMNE